MLNALLQQARARNAGLGITGMLIYAQPADGGPGTFTQHLEGSRDAVRTLFYESILHDERHAEVRVLLEGPLAERSFAAWSMAFERADGTRQVAVNLLEQRARSRS